MKKQKGAVLLIILLVLAILGINFGVWYSYFKGKTAMPEEETLVSPSPTPTVDETELIKQAVFRKTGLDETEAEVTISINTGTHAKGNIKEFEAVGGAYWLAAKTSEGWVCVYDGQAHPSCSQIDPYDFPVELVPECLSETGTVVSR